MISKYELNPNNYPLTPEQQKNFERLYICINAIRIAYGKPLIITSGVRNTVDQQRINPKAPASKHLLAAAADISDPKGELWDWMLKNLDFLKKLDVYLEAKSATPTWVHCQILPPKSGNRIFIP